MVISPEQIRAARALLRMDQEELARRAQVSVVTVRRLESIGGTEKVGAETVNGIRQALEDAGARFFLDGVQRRPELSPEAEERYRAAMKIAKECAAMLEGTPPFTEADLYDENGL
jgi:transcriptional regulator with XRE-family HTH domain